MKLCKDCAHFRELPTGNHCAALEFEPDYVNGGPATLWLCALARTSSSPKMCGIEGRLFTTSRLPDFRDPPLREPSTDGESFACGMPFRAGH